MTEREVAAIVEPLVRSRAFASAEDAIRTLVRDYVLRTEAFAEDQFHFKVRASLTEPFHLQVRFYYNHGHLDYAYQLFNGGPILRWDNKEDAGNVPTAPHHFHSDKSEYVKEARHAQRIYR